jgi:type VI secretion system protein ImpH
MASQSGAAADPVIALLRRNPKQFTFPQAVRLIGWLNTVEPSRYTSPTFEPGHDSDPTREWVELLGWLQHRFPPAELMECLPPQTQVESESQPWRLTLSLFGAYGPIASLPQADTWRLFKRDAKAVRSFIDLYVTHRCQSFLYRATTKYSAPLSLEAHRIAKQAAPGEEADRLPQKWFEDGLLALCGLGMPSLMDRHRIADRQLASLAGLLVSTPRSAINLEQMLQTFFGWPLQLEQLVGQWLTLPQEERWQLGRSPSGFGCQGRLGDDCVLGERVWNIDGKFRIAIGPIDCPLLDQLRPGGDRWQELVELVRLFVGPTYDVDITFILQAAEVPSLQLGSHRAELGVTSWLLSGPSNADRSETVFQMPTGTAYPPPLN